MDTRMVLPLGCVESTHREGEREAERWRTTVLGLDLIADLYRELCISNAVKKREGDEMGSPISEI